MKHINEYTPSYLIDEVIAHLTKTKGYTSENQAASLGISAKEFYKAVERLTAKIRFKFEKLADGSTRFCFGGLK